MRNILSIISLFISLISFGQHDTTWIPFSVKLIVNTDTLSKGFSFYLSSKKKILYPTINSNLGCSQFHNVDSIMDFHLLFNNRHYVYSNLETVRLMHNTKWYIAYDSLACDSCYTIIAKRLGCFINGYMAESSNKNRMDNTNIWVVELFSDEIILRESNIQKLTKKEE